MSKPCEWSPIRVTKTTTAGGALGSGVVGPRHDKIGFGAGLQVATKGGNRRSIDEEAKEKQAASWIGEVGHRNLSNIESCEGKGVSCVIDPPRSP